jgi:hypothetical protein
VVGGNLMTSVSGSSKLAVRTLLPANPALRVDWNTKDGQKLNPRLAVSDAAPGTDRDLLNVVTVSDARAAPRASALVRAASGEMIGAEVRGAKPGDRETVMLFGAAPTATEPLASGLKYRIVTSGPSRHYLFDLPPGHAYAVQVQPAAGAQQVVVSPAGGPGTRVQTNEAGILSFEVQSGGAVTLFPR